MAAFLKENYGLICLFIGILGVLIGIISVFCETKKRKRNKNMVLLLCFWMVACLSACRPQAEYCTVKGSVNGIPDGMKLELQDEFDHFKVVGTARVKDGTFEIRPRVSAPTHVYLYSGDGEQLKDFFLEPGSVVADVDATAEDDRTLGAAGTPANDICKDIHLLYLKGEDAAADRRWEEIIDAGENGILALYYASHISRSALKSLAVVDRLSGEIAAKPSVAELRDELMRRAKTEPAPAGAEAPNFYIDMEYPDVAGNPVSLSSVVGNPANRLVLLDFWATWCGPCRETIPALKDLYAKYHGRGLEIYSVSEDAGKANWKSFLEENGIAWINVLDTNAGRKHSKVWFEYALHGIPTMILLDGESGAILYRGKLADIEAEIASLLE